MRPWWWAGALGAVLTCSVTYLLFNQTLVPDRPLAASDVSARPSVIQTPDQPVTGKDEARLQDVDSASAVLKQDQLPAAQEEARLENVSRPEAGEASSP